MRTHARLLICGALGATSACSWAQFDDLKDDTWVGTTEKPALDSSEYGVAIQRGALGSPTASGGSLVVIGTADPTRSQLVYDDRGDSRVASNTVELKTLYGISTLETQPILIADPAGDDVSLVINSGVNQITMLTGTDQIELHQVFFTPSAVDAAAYIRAPGAPRAQPLIASGEFVIATFYAGQPVPQTKCRLTDGGAAISPRALGAVPAGNVDDVLAWGANGKLYKYPSDVFNGCAADQEPLASIDTTFKPARGSQILRLDDTHVVLQGHNDGDGGFLQVFQWSAGPPETLTAVGGAVAQSKLRAAAILDRSDGTYVIAGCPTAAVDGDGPAAGEVRLFAVSATTGIEATATTTLHDAQPEGNQAFGRSVAALPFNGTQVIAVAASNEIFVYFRSPLYDETRQGR
jgi:hypothetical protein